MQQDGLQEISIKKSEDSENKLNQNYDFDEEGNRLLYVNKNFPLQKWNNIVINYNGGTIDIFLNNELVKSSIGIVPYYKLDSLNVGEENGLEGAICNLVYFKKPLSNSNMYYLYNLVKNKTPPITTNNTLV